jgi:hypothetical protein
MSVCNIPRGTPYYAVFRSRTLPALNLTTSTPVHPTKSHVALCHDVVCVYIQLVAIS